MGGGVVLWLLVVVLCWSKGALGQFHHAAWAYVESPAGVTAHFQSPTDWLTTLYHKYHDDVHHLRRYLRAWAEDTDLHQGVGDVEAEIIYLRLRELQPENVAEYGFGQGLTSVYILVALKENNKGTLHSFDKLDKHGRVKNIPSDLSMRWKFHLGDARATSPRLGLDFDYIHSDAQHSVQFAQWLCAHDLGKQREVHVSFHDAFVKEGLLNAGAKALQGVTPEAMVVLKWLARNEGRVQHLYSIAASHFATLNRELMRARKAEGLDEKWIATKPTTLNQPSMFFQLGAQSHT